MDEDGDVWVEPGSQHPDYGLSRPLLFLAVPEAKAVKNRLHLDLRPDDQELEVERLEALGAIQVSVGQSGLEDWIVLADPEGNEFCVLGRQLIGLRSASCASAAALASAAFRYASSWSSSGIRSWPTVESNRAAISSGVHLPSAYMARTSRGWFHTAIFGPTDV